VYLIFALTDSLTSPIARTKDSNDVGAVREPDGDEDAARFAKAEVALLASTMGCVQRDNAVWISKGELSLREAPTPASEKSRAGPSG
jgi:hypothetical protein